MVNDFFLDQEDDENHIVVLGAYEIDGVGLGSSLTFWSRNFTFKF